MKKSLLLKLRSMLVKKTCVISLLTKKFSFLLLLGMFGYSSSFSSTGEFEGIVRAYDGNNITFEIYRLGYISHWRDLPYGDTIITSLDNATVCIIDGMLSNMATVKDAISPGKYAYLYNNRGSDQSFAIKTTPPIIMGEIVDVDEENNQFSVRHYMCKGGCQGKNDQPDYVDRVMTYDPSMVIKYEGEAMDATSAIKVGRYARVHEERKQTILSFTPEALYQDPIQPYKSHYGKYLRVYNQQGFIKGWDDGLAYLAEHRNGEWINSYRIGQLSRTRRLGTHLIYFGSGVRPGDRAVYVSYNKSSDPTTGMQDQIVYVSPSDEGIIEGYIVEINGDDITVEHITCPTGDKADVDTSLVVVSLEADALYNVDGNIGRSKTEAIQVGQYVKVLQEWSGAVLVDEGTYDPIDRRETPPALEPYFITDELITPCSEWLFQPNRLDTISALENEVVKFSAGGVDVSTTNTQIIYQWYKDGVSIPGANTLFNYSRVASVSDHGSVFTCVATGAGGTAESPPIVLHVEADVTPLSIQEAAIADEQTITLTYNKEVDKTSAENIANYNINQGVTIDNVTLTGDLKTVVINTSVLTTSTSYEITVNNVKDKAATPNTIADNYIVSTTAFPGGKEVQEIDFTEITDKDISESPFSVDAVSTSGLNVSYSILSGPASVSNFNQITLTDTGTIKIRAIQNGNNSYYSAYAEQEFKVTLSEKLDQTINFEAIDDPTLVRTLPGKIGLSAIPTSGLFVSFEVISGNVTLSQNVLTVHDTGQISVRATQEGNYIYNAAPEVIQTFMLDTFRGNGYIEFHYASEEVSMMAGDTHTFQALVYDKYGDLKTEQPTITWAVEGQGTIDQNGFYTAPSSTGKHYVIASVTVNDEILADTATVYVKATQTITCHQFDSVYYLHDPFPLQCYASSGLPVEYEKINGPFSLDGNIVTLLGVPGTAFIAAKQSGNEFYNPATSRMLSFVISTTEPDDIIYNVETISSSQTFSLYPNPSDGIVYIKGDYDIDCLRVIDLTGKTMINVSGPIESVDMSKCNPGMYILEIDACGQKIFKKIIKK